MNNLIKASNLNINSWLINWGLMKGQLNGGILETTKFSLINHWAGFSSSLFIAIKWTILLFYSKNDKLTHLLGDWRYFIGPKVIIDSIVIISACYYISVN